MRMAAPLMEGGVWYLMEKNNQCVQPEEIVLSMEHITKIYENGFVANKDINFSLKRGEIHGLVGENGAGKTTLMKVLFGHEQPDIGRILVNGQEVHITNPLVALDKGIGMVHQHFTLVQSLTVAENMVLGKEPRRHGMFDMQRAIQMTEEVAQKYDLEVNPLARVKDLSVGYKQRVEILKILLKGAQILLLDEPTAVLTPQETHELFAQLKRLKEHGFTIVFISHKLNEVKEICDRITVLRKGRVIGHADINDVDEKEISRMMVGRDVVLDIPKKEAHPQEVLLRVRNVRYKNAYQVDTLKGVSFDVRGGEILGVAGVEGNGQAELAELITGLLPLTDGDIQIAGKSIKGTSIRQIRQRGASLVHEDRMIYGVSGTQSIEENLVSDRYYKKEYSKWGILNQKRIHESAQKMIDEYLIKCDGPMASVQTLSGGNIQKVVAAREFSSKPDLLVVCQPTRGIDVGAAEVIRNQMVALRDECKTGILMFSADLTEILTVSDSIIVLHNGRIVAYFPDSKKVDENMLGEYMLGLKAQGEEEIGGVQFA